MARDRIIVPHCELRNRRSQIQADVWYARPRAPLAIRRTIRSWPSKQRSRPRGLWV